MSGGPTTNRSRCTAVIRTQRLHWLGHSRTENNKTSADRRRPRTKWIEVVEKDLPQRRVRNWKQLAMEKYV